ncbi:hypothetical protein GCM10009801_02780 [Streptomyces albiaxialis]|uniref:Uncharacterized protein n=1 Tax=Streptomyces albiaxialis TaxID=329523 RepID=A0ABP5H192_9ACTN
MEEMAAEAAVGGSGVDGLAVGEGGLFGHGFRHGSGLPFRACDEHGQHGAAAPAARRHGGTAVRGATQTGPGPDLPAPSRRRAGR